MWIVHPVDGRDAVTKPNVGISTNIEQESQEELNRNSWALPSGDSKSGKTPITSNCHVHVLIRASQSLYGEEQEAGLKAEVCCILLRRY